MTKEKSIIFNLERIILHMWAYRNHKGNGYKNLTQWQKTIVDSIELEDRNEQIEYQEELSKYSDLYN